MNKQEAEQRLASMRAGARREALVQSGAYDGRYRSRVVQSKKHKKIGRASCRERVSSPV